MNLNRVAAVNLHPKTLLIACTSASRLSLTESKVAALSAAQQGRSSKNDFEMAAYLKEHVPELDFASVEGANAKLVEAAKGVNAARADHPPTAETRLATASSSVIAEPVHPLWQQLADWRKALAVARVDDRPKGSE